MRGLRLGLVRIAILIVAGGIARDGNAQLLSGDGEFRIPSRFILECPYATEFCQPTKTAFADAATTFRIVHGKRIQQHPNGGYGQLFNIGGVPLYHTAADIGWFRTGEPVYAVANGVVRMSMPSIRKELAKQGIRLAAGRGPMDFGNFILIEHKTPDQQVFNSFYAHLGDERFVQVGDIVTAGQRIGSIGRKSVVVNGGYDPHLHFGMRTGQIGKPGQDAFGFVIGGKPVIAKLISVDEAMMKLSLSSELPGDLKFQVGRPGDMREVRLVKKEDHYELPSWFLCGMMPRSKEMHIAGYTPTIEGWFDPIQFLKDNGAGTGQVSHYELTSLGDSEVPSAEGRDAVAIESETILNGDVMDFDLPTMREKVICLIGFQLSCRASQGIAIPALRALQDEYQTNDRVRILGVSANRTNRSQNSLESLHAAIAEAQIDLPVAYLPKVDQTFIESFGMHSTPWVVLIDPKGKIDLSNACFNHRAISRRIQLILANEIAKEDH
ncbi:MAG: peptidoglycan DD-metalloendopeptidase family protein [Planctomycetaceae bacterium]|nr:peptidoglycan DD-metalloendopeptidase family protein [Planctomycetaceae bacterium]